MGRNTSRGLNGFNGFQSAESVQSAANIHLALIILLSSLLLFTSLHKGSLSGYDDALFAHEGKQMLATGDWGTVRDNGIPNFELPPLFIWLEALSMKVWGVTDFAAKFPAALAGLLAIILTFLTARAWSDDFWVPIAAAWVLMLTQYFLKYSMHAMTDSPFTFFFALAVYLYTKSRARPWLWVACGVVIGLAILMRSILGLLPAGVIAAHLLWTRERVAHQAGYVLLGALAALAVPLAWYVAQYRRYGDEFLSIHLSFISGKAISVNGVNFWGRLRGIVEYPWLLLRLYWPWLPLMLLGLATAVKRAIRQRDKLATLLVVWLVIVVVPLSLADAKVLRYIMPAFPAFAILAALPLSNWLDKVPQRSLRIGCGVLCGVVVLIAIFSAPLDRAEEMKSIAPIVDQHTPVGERVLIYTYGQPRYDYVNQLLWYSNRFSEHVPDVHQLSKRLRSGEGRAFVVDKAAYEEMVVTSGVSVSRLCQTENFVCFRTAAGSP